MGERIDRRMITGSANPIDRRDRREVLWAQRLTIAVRETLTPPHPLTSLVEQKISLCGEALFE
jgi:hypothetical protein